LQTGWKRYMTGSSHVSYGGAIVFQLGIIKKQAKYMSAKKLRKTLKIGRKMKMFLILGSVLPYGHLQRWAGRIKRTLTSNVTTQRILYSRVNKLFTSGLHV